ncbi:SET domain-containing protein SmydA-8, isoform A [Chionoecetes opilio]|uniref:SET domain-containing protein SmydA-8, isoform A n=1 Tax=Chionoecetes opilio TaxID=41210 RepID=A0A8J5CXG8_CHIOP|nr:SET domain-containing protein SmydA-8, isoform A [Chionoecetes opilio]
MPGESHGDVPVAVPLQVAMEASALCNGHASTPTEPAKTLTCSECAKVATIVCGGCWTAGFCARDHQLTGWTKHRPKCRPWRVSSSPDLGRFMVATKDIAGGELLMEDAPLMMGPKMMTEPVCLGCYRPVDGDYNCKGCGFPLCSSDCEGTEDHEAECRAVQASGIHVKVSMFGEVNSMYECITPLRVLSLRDKNPSLWNKLMSLESNSDMREGTEVAAITQQTVVDIIHNRLQLEDEFGTEIIDKVLGILDTNAFEIRLPDSSILGVYQKASLLEHDCIPNTHRTFDADLNLVIRAAVPIKRGQHLTSCYTEPLSTTNGRQEHLRSTKYFTCSCKRCRDPTELKTFTSGIKCGDCVEKQEEAAKQKRAEEKEARGRGGTRGGKRGGVASRINKFQTGAQGESSSTSQVEEEKITGPWIVPQDPLSPSSNWVCLTCKSSTTDDYPERITSVMQEEAEELEETNPNIEACETFLEKWNSTFHPNHACFLNIKYVLLHLYGSEEGYELEELTPIHLTRKEELCQEVMKVADVIQPGISRLRGSVLYELYQAIFYKTRAMSMVGAIPAEQARKMAMEALTALKECARVLSYEPEVQPEGQLGLEAKEEIKMLQKWIKQEGWKY